MHSSLAVVLAAALSPTAGLLPNLDFAAGDLSHWQGSGFQTRLTGVSSHDARGQAILHRTFTVPAATAAIRFKAAATRAAGTGSGPVLDIYLEAANRRLIPKQVLASNDWKPAGALLPFLDGAFRDYQWDLAGLEGQQVRIVLLDQDDRPGCYVACDGFKLVPRQDAAIKEFVDFIAGLAKKHHLAPFARFDSKHFVALANVDDGFVEHRLGNCETIYELFYPQFRGKGFAVLEPKGKLMVAIFDSQAGFEAYLGQRMPTSVSGIYDTPSNRLVVYDFAGNRSFVQGKKSGERQARQINDDMTRQRYLGSISRSFADYRNDLNISTIVHEVAHQLSFNGGLLNRHGDAPVWLIEGLATYCEPASHGSWAGIGEPNPGRAGTLASLVNKGREFIRLRDLISSDDWLRKSRDSRTIVLGYAQSWALFRMLMEEKPRELKKFMVTIYARKTPDHRLVDFSECFGGDLDQLERRFLSYMRKVAVTEARPQ